MKYLNPETLAEPHGYNHGVAMTPTPGGGVLFLAGQVGWNRDGTMVSDDFVEQFDQALANLLDVVALAGGTPTSIGKLTIFVTDRTEYMANLSELGERYRSRMGRHYPAMTLVEVSALLETGAKVEIDGMACV